ncbi:sporulation integral membrane protein YlbJ [Vallitalea okinawensis]|uniref:sporulation integral membrane protein YlbJ n=1 Tax=Vallitalea okinawensis TaxID=2078660 RepID=UPI000CFCE6E0|nr:sporulation integral membrane protein YlbJ [Vallitalea okinawensis]
MRQYTLLISFILVFVISIFIFPQITVEAAHNGLELWLNAVLPSLFPFIVLMNLLVELDFFKVVGRFLEPIMKKIFCLPGCAGFIWLSSITSGYPVGAKIIVDLIDKGDISKDEGQHLLNFCNNSGPLFILGTVSVGMLSLPESGYLLLLTHLLSSLCVGFIFRFRIPHQSYRPKRMLPHKQSKQYDIGKLLGNSIKSGMELMLIIGGFVILFSVIMQLIQTYGILSLLLGPLDFLFKAFHMSTTSLESFILGFIEITNGISLIAKEPMFIPLQLSFVSFLIAWSGLSIHAQTASVIKGSGLNFTSYMKAKCLQGCIAAVLTYFLTPYFIDVEELVPTFNFNYYVGAAIDNFSLILLLIMLWALLVLITSHKAHEND